MQVFRCFTHVTALKKYRSPVSVPTSVTPPDMTRPRRHPILMNDPLSEVISYRIPNRPLTPLHQVPIQAQYAFFPPFIPPESGKTATIAILGAPNAGKSMLVNSLVGAKVAIVSRKINSTQKMMPAVVTKGDIQIVFQDTPGIISSHGGKTSRLSTVGWDAIKDSEKSVFVVDAVKRLQSDVQAAVARLQTILESQGIKSEVPEAKLVGETDQHTEARRRKTHARIPAALVINKCDLVTDRRRVKCLVGELFEYANFEKVFYTSANTGYGVEQVLEYAKEAAKPGLWRFHPAQVSGMSDTEKVEEVVREYVLDRYHDELPYNFVTRTVGWTPYLDGSLRIDQDLYVKSEAQKGIILGSEGHGIERMKTQVQATLVKMYQRPINLILTVKLMKSYLRLAVRRTEDISKFKHYQPMAEFQLDPNNPAKQIKQ